MKQRRRRLSLVGVLFSSIIFIIKLPSSSAAAAAAAAYNNNNILSVSVMAKPTNTSLTSDYKDNWFDRIAINHLSNSLQATIGFRSNKSGYEGLVEATAMTRQKFSPTQQRQLVIQALDAAFPKPILSFASRSGQCYHHLNFRGSFLPCSLLYSFLG